MREEEEEEEGGRGRTKMRDEEGRILKHVKITRYLKVQCQQV